MLSYRPCFFRTSHTADMSNSQRVLKHGLFMATLLLCLTLSSKSSCLIIIPFNNLIMIPVSCDLQRVGAYPVRSAVSPGLAGSRPHPGPSPLMAPLRLSAERRPPSHQERKSISGAWRCVPDSLRNPMRPSLWNKTGLEIMLCKKEKRRKIGDSFPSLEHHAATAHFF